MKESLGRRIAELRREKGIKQEELAEQLGVSPQAVSKWENDLSCPDIMLLPKLAGILGVTVDELLGNEEKKPETQMVPKEELKSMDEKVLHILVDDPKGDKVRVNLPIPLVKMGLKIGMSIPQVAGNEALEGIDLNQIMTLVDNGVIGKLVEVSSADGTVVEIVVE